MKMEFENDLHVYYDVIVALLALLLLRVARRYPQSAAGQGNRESDEMALARE